MSEPLNNPLADDLHARIHSLLEELDRLFVSVRTLTEDSLDLRNPDLSLQGIRTGYSLSEATGHLKRLNRLLIYHYSGVSALMDGKAEQPQKEGGDA